MKGYFFFFSLIFLFFNSNKLWANRPESGTWRFELKSTHATIPFITELIVSKNKITGTLFNRKEKVRFRLDLEGNGAFCEATIVLICYS